MGPAMGRDQRSASAEPPASPPHPLLPGTASAAAVPEGHQGGHGSEMTLWDSGPSTINCLPVFTLW